MTDPAIIIGLALLVIVAVLYLIGLSDALFKSVIFFRIFRKKDPQGFVSLHFVDLKKIPGPRSMEEAVNPRTMIFGKVWNGYSSGLFASVNLLLMLFCLAAFSALGFVAGPIFGIILLSPFLFVLVAFTTPLEQISCISPGAFLPNGRMVISGTPFDFFHHPNIAYFKTSIFWKKNSGYSTQIATQLRRINAIMNIGTFWGLAGLWIIALPFIIWYALSKGEWGGALLAIFFELGLISHFYVNLLSKPKAKNEIDSRLVF